MHLAFAIKGLQYASSLILCCCILKRVTASHQATKAHITFSSFVAFSMHFKHANLLNYGHDGATEENLTERVS